MQQLMTNTVILVSKILNGFTTLEITSAQAPKTPHDQHSVIQAIIAFRPVDIPTAQQLRD